MAAARLTEKGQIVIPAEIRARYGLTAGTQVEFVDEGGAIRLLVRRRVTPTDPVDGFGLIKVPSKGKARRLEAFDAAAQVPARPARKASR